MRRIRIGVLLILQMMSPARAFAPNPVASTRWIRTRYPQERRSVLVQKQIERRRMLASLFQKDTGDYPSIMATAVSDEKSRLKNSVTLIDDDEEETYGVAIRNTILSVAAAVVFGVGLWWTVGPVTGEEFFAGYLVEKSLSVDNLFVFLLLFDFFQIPAEYQGRILTYGIWGSIVMRSIMIGLGAAALANARGILLVFAGILIYSAFQVLFDVEDENEEDLNANPVIQLSRRMFPSTDTFDGETFFTIEDGIKKATPLFICMIAVELSDVVFAVDSIPAVFGVTENPLVVFSSNMFAILGLRSLYPILSKAATELQYLEPAVAVVLAFIGGKMIYEYFGHEIQTTTALAVIISLLALGVGASLWENARNETVGD